MNRNRVLSIGFTVLSTILCMTKTYASATVAPEYPGSVVDIHGGDVTVRVYLSHDPLKKVAAWYARKIGVLDKNAGNTLWNADGLESHVGRPNGALEPQVTNQQLGRVTMHQSQVVKSLKDMTMTKDIGVFCEGMHFKPKQGDPQQAAADSTDAGTDMTDVNAMMQQLNKMQAQLNRANQHILDSMGPQNIKIAQMGNIFDGFKQEVGRHGHTKRQLIAVYTKYKHLETAWYPTVKTSNGLKSYDRWLLESKTEQLKAKDHAAATPAIVGGDDAQALAARMQSAAAAGRMDEMQALGEKMQRTMEGQQDTSQRGPHVTLKDHWRFWLAFLKDLDAHAYRTRIWINTSPNTWGY